MKTVNIHGTEGHSVTKELPELVYFMYSAGKIKIGYSKNIYKRLTDLSNAAGAPVTLIAVVHGDRDFEIGLHRLFKADREHGEWFRISDEIRRYLGCIDMALMATLDLEAWLGIGSCVKRLEEAEKAA